MRTWNDAVDHWRTENFQRTEKWKKDEAGLLRWLAPHLDGVALVEIDAARIHEIRIAKIREGVSAYTVNAHLAVIRAVLRACVDWGWLPQAPRIKFLRRPPPAVTHVMPDQAARLLAELPPHTRDIAAFSLETGLRKKNVTGLLWAWVDLAGGFVHIPALQAKGRKPISLPISEAALGILRRWEGQHPSHVFHYQGRPITETNTRAFRAARARAGLSAFRWHDLRHTWASWHAMSGTPLLSLQQLGGWSTVQMVGHYAHLQAESLRPWVRQVGRWGVQRRAV